MQIKQTLSWKFLLLGWLILMAISMILKESLLGTFIELLALVLFLLGIIGLIRAGIKRQKNNKIIKEKVAKRMLDLGLDLEKDYNEYYKILKEEEEELKKKDG